MCSFVNPRLVPGWADAEAVVQGFTATKGVNYTGLYFNSRGLERALEYKDKLNLSGSISLAASEGFTKKNLNRSHPENLAAMKKHVSAHLDKKISVSRIGVMAMLPQKYKN